MNTILFIEENIDKGKISARGGSASGGEEIKTEEAAKFKGKNYFLWIIHFRFVLLFFTKPNRFSKPVRFLINTLSKQKSKYYVEKNLRKAFRLLYY